MKLCSPALLYLILSLFSVLIALSSKFQPFTILVKLIFISLWTYFLNFLCIKGYSDVSWFLVVLPFFIMLGMFIIAFETLSVAKKNYKQ